MMRIQLASGEEAVYRTVDELAMGISSGTITAAARFYDFPAQAWRSIDSHPEYHMALARAATLGGTLELAPPQGDPATPLIHPVERTRTSGPFQIYQMFSLSAAELQAKRRPAWLLPATAAIGALAMLLSVVLLLRGARRHETTVLTEAAPLSVTSSSATTPTPDLVQLPAHSSVEAMRLAPVNLNSHLAFAMDIAGRRLGDTAGELGVRALLSRGRQMSADSVRLTREVLASVRSLVANYRAAQRFTAAAYRDTATMLAKSGFWSKIDQQEWRVYPPSSESPREAIQADSVLSILEQLFELLDEQPGGYRDAGGRLQFDDPTSGAQYDRLRAVLLRHQEADDTGIKPNGALALLRRSLTPPSGQSFGYSRP